MRLISYGIIGLIVIVSLLGIETHQLKQIESAKVQTRYIEMSLEQATEDATNAMLTSSENLMWSENIISGTQPKIVVETFFNSLAQSLNMTSKEDIIQLSCYIPFIAIVDSEGYYLYVSTQKKGEGYTYNKVLLPKIDFIKQINNKFVFLNSGNMVKIMYRDQQEWNVEYNERQTWINKTVDTELKAFLEQANYHNRIKTLKLQQFEEDLSHFTNVHNAYAKDRGIFYSFAFKPIGDSWTGIVDKPSIIVALQGLPTGTEQQINILSLNNFSISKEDYYYGIVKNGVRYYTKSTCQDLKNLKYEAVFTSRQEAAKQGYYPCKDCFK